MKRITKNFLLVLLSLFVLTVFSLQAEKPNVLFILVDDLGWADLGCYGARFHETPHIDQFAKGAARFTQAYAAAPVCSPTRASILSGKYPARINFTRATPTHNFPAEEITLAEALQEGGYRTAHIGKWHMQLYGEKGKGSAPEDHGFDVNIAGHAAGQPASFFWPYEAKAPKYEKNNVPCLRGGKEGEYLTDRLTDEAIKFMDSTKERPFYLSLCYYTVHTPVTGKKEKILKYKKKAEAIGLSLESGSWSEYDSFSRKQQNHTEYAAMVESMDENVGRLLTYLEESGKAENTLVIFMSDNGGLSVGKSKKGGPACSLPLRAGKAWVYEGGIREPLIIRLPGEKKGTVLDAQVISTDFYPTILEVAGMNLKPDQHLDGISLFSLLKGKTSKLNREALYFHFPHDHGVNSMGASGAVRIGDYKLVERFSNGNIELFNLKEDIGEQNDLAGEKPEQAKKMQKQLADWRKSIAAMMPVTEKTKPRK